MSSRAAERRGDPQDRDLDCVVGIRLLAKTPTALIQLSHKSL